MSSRKRTICYLETLMNHSYSASMNANWFILVVLGYLLWNQEMLKQKPYKQKKSQNKSPPVTIEVLKYLTCTCTLPSNDLKTQWLAKSASSRSSRLWLTKTVIMFVAHLEKTTDVETVSLFWSSVTVTMTQMLQQMDKSWWQQIVLINIISFSWLI